MVLAWLEGPTTSVSMFGPHSAVVVALAAQVETQLHHRFLLLVHREKRAVIAARAVARESCGFIWALMVEVPA